MRYPIEGGPKVGDIVTLEGRVNMCSTSGLIGVDVSKNEMVDNVQCRASNVRTAKRPRTPQVGDRLLAKHMTNADGTILAKHEGYYWVHLDTGVRATMHEDVLQNYTVMPGVTP